MEPEQRTAIVTGAAVRIGRALAVAIAGAGVRVVVHYGRSADEAEETVGLIRQGGGEAVAVAAELSDPVAAAETVFGRAEEAFGEVGILVNNAAVFEGGTLGETSEGDWDRLFAVNLKAPYFFCRRFVAGISPDAAGQIINLVDWRGLRPDASRLAYSLTKNGLVVLTRTLARELAPRVRVNAIAPGPILPARGADRGELDAAAAATPLARAGSTDDVVAALQYLLDAQLVTGEVLSVAGGAELF